MKKKNVAVGVAVEVEATPVVESLYEGQTFIEGKKGGCFSLKISNNSLFGGDCEVVVSVDGLSVLTGQLASQESEGVHVPKRDAVTISRWANGEKFYFGQLPELYKKNASTFVNRRGGVIGVAVRGTRVTEEVLILRYVHYSLSKLKERGGGIYPETEPLLTADPFPAG